MAVNYDRKSRIQRLKKIILGAVAAAIIIPVITSVVLGVRVSRLKMKVEELEARLSPEGYQEEGESVYTIASIEESSRKAGAAEGKRTGSRNVLYFGDLEAEEAQEDRRKVYLTFDDGPSRNTDRILDILKEYDVKATFFVVGKTDENSVKAYQRIVDEGHTLAMHSYSHKYDEIYESRENFVEDTEKLQEYLYQVTGIWPRFYRFPGGSSNTVSQVDMQELIQYFNECGITYFDWNVSSGDAASGQVSAQSMVENCVKGVEGKDVSVILMHDAANKDTTVEALPEIIRQIKEQGDTVFLPVSDETALIQHITAE